jgi:shikimate dehydrogenase
MRYEALLAPLDGFARACAPSRRGRARPERHRALQARGLRALADTRSPRAEAAKAVNTLIFRPPASSATTPTAPAWCADLTRNLGVRLPASASCCSAPAARRAACCCPCWNSGRRR